MERSGGQWTAMGAKGGPWRPKEDKGRQRGQCRLCGAGAPRSSRGSLGCGAGRSRGEAAWRRGRAPHAEGLGFGVVLCRLDFLFLFIFFFSGFWLWAFGVCVTWRARSQEEEERPRKGNKHGQRPSMSHEEVVQHHKMLFIVDEVNEGPRNIFISAPCGMGFMGRGLWALSCRADSLLGI